MPVHPSRTWIVHWQDGFYDSTLRLSSFDRPLHSTIVDITAALYFPKLSHCRMSNAPLSMFLAQSIKPRQALLEACLDLIAGQTLTSHFYDINHSITPFPALYRGLSLLSLRLFYPNSR